MKHQADTGVEFRAEMGGGVAEGEPGIIYADPSDPLPTARLFVDMRHTRDGRRLIHRHRGAFVSYNGACWPETPADALRAQLYDFLELAKYCRPGKKAGEVVEADFKPNTTKVGHVLDALGAAAYLDDATDMPAWLDGRASPDPSQLLPMRNGLLDLRTGRLLAPTPGFFNGWALDFDYEPDAPEPAEWLAFLGSVWPNDREAVDTLQEMLGYLLGSDTRQQKVFMLVGPPRSGKGTVARVTRALLGAANVAGPTLSSLATNFGLQPLIGKPVAIVSDARLSGKVDAHVIAERMLSISGEDALTIDRKYSSAWTGTLPTRFVILTNELPRIADASGALASRFVVLVMTQSFLGREDHGLTGRLLSELPGILNWAIEGWRRLDVRGHFLAPASSAEAMEELAALGSPIRTFVDQCCTVVAGALVACDTLYDQWVAWCESQGRDHPGTKQTFGRDLRAAVPGLTTTRPRAGDDRHRVFNGIRVATAADRAERETAAWSAVVRGPDHCTRSSDREVHSLEYNGVDRGPLRTTGLAPGLATCPRCRKPARIKTAYCGPCEDECAAMGRRF